MIKKIQVFACAALCVSQTAHALTITRVILATNDNPNYIQFWPIAAKAWSSVVGLRPTLALIADDSVTVDETIGDVIRIKPIEGVSTALHAQLIRLLLPICFPNEGCLLSDIDMIPLTRDYFIKSVQHLPENSFAVYRDRAYKNLKQYPMCYNAGRGATFASVFGISNPSEIEGLIKHWNSLKIGWFTDETMLFRYLNAWPEFSRRCIKLGHDVEHRLDRSDWRCDFKKLKSAGYIDAHCPRPYAQYKAEIDPILMALSVEV